MEKVEYLIQHDDNCSSLFFEVLASVTNNPERGDDIHNYTLEELAEGRDQFAECMLCIPEDLEEQLQGNDPQLTEGNLLSSRREQRLFNDVYDDDLRQSYTNSFPHVVASFPHIEARLQRVRAR